MPFAIQNQFTYKITRAESKFLKRGMRVAVEFGTSKICTGLVNSIHQNEPTAYEAKEIHQILDESPIVNEKQLQHWEWISSYYMCTLGEVFRAALPSAFLLQSETEIILNQAFVEENSLSNDEFLIYEALKEYHTRLSVNQVIDILNKKKVLPVLKAMLDKNVIYINEQIYEQYKPKLIKYIQLCEQWNNDDKLHELLNLLKNAKKQREVIMTYFQLKTSKKPIKVVDLKKLSNSSSAIIKSLIDKDILEYYFIQKDRVNFECESIEIKELTEHQSKAHSEIKNLFKTEQTVLMKGITSSGKTEVYIKLIKELLEHNKQVLYLVPEIALTTQLIERLQVFFGEYISVFHSRYSIDERVEVWNNVLENKQKAQLILGARSSLFLPFSNLGLIVVDEEHEHSYKQFDPAPRYHARDSAIVLANIHKSKVLLGSATPSVESYYNVKKKKYGYVELNRRFGNILLPEIELVDIKDKYKRKKMKGHFSDRLIELITETLDEKKQVILFQNRRGYAPVVTCETCGISPQCSHCDVTLTYHIYRKELRCHYCGYRRSMPNNCGACGSEKLNTKGFGTEQIEMELQDFFPEHKIGRMDLDTTRGKYSYQKIIGQFQAQEIDVLVGTQMLSKGLDFANVALVGVMNADNSLYYPDFRAHERCFQMLVQVSGRAGRANKRGKVIIQTFDPFHQILQQVSTNSYDEMFKEQLEERWQYHYPPFYRLIKFTLSHKDFNKVEEGANWLGKSFSATFKENVLGPTTPAISKIRNYYIRNIIIKIPPKQSIKDTKQKIIRIKNTFQAIKQFRSIKLNIDVDNY